MAKPEKRRKARKLRRQGWSISAIVDALDVNKNTVMRWCRAIKLTEAQKDALEDVNPRWRGQQAGAKANRQRALEKRQAYQQAGREKAREGIPLHRKACMLYWAEGAKSRNRLGFVNTDANMLKLFMRFLREIMQVPDEKIRLRVQTHEPESQWSAIADYWRDCLQLADTHEVKLMAKKGTKSRKAHYPYGICRISVNSVEILQHIYGAIQEYAGFDNPEWVK